MDPERPGLFKDAAVVPVPAPGTAASVLASDAEREALVERLRVATGEGRLTLEELADRCEAAYLARTREQLAVLGQDLPATGETSTGTDATTGAGGGVSAGTATGKRKFAAMVGDVTCRTLAAHGSDTLDAYAVLGDLILDLCGMTAPSSGELTVTAWAVFGDVRLIVPEGVQVELACGSVLGDVRDLTRAHTAPQGRAPRIRVAGAAICGDITLAHPGDHRNTSWRRWLEEAIRGRPDPAPRPRP
ncbi:hypothetical protein GCM10010313_01200 [Streptomyces violarus]|uniref:DUF1707 domain-containing protein n=1 Tax=Streptomyces violarus TaxID=67380 RepID=A0A7W5EYS9_9ACTN|nr:MULTISPECIES: DUF1707 domain-containing protein [Streptomyces]MBB3073651.1 hypothetical protein [Streptomyces violarus]WRT96414.1 DUF1707 domain-containing protein [Streptomyces sp. CGMCC 4.1772]GHC95759.1 hypothetical protein GCM10010313_01200 [Streptomyces violarus]